MPTYRRLPRYTASGVVDTALGIDLSALPDLDPTFSLQRGNAVLGEALLRRFSTPKGSLTEDPSYGCDLRALVNASISSRRLFEIKNSLEREALSDPRVSTATASVEYNQATQTMRASIEVSTAAGPFQFVFGISSATVELLGIQ